MSAAQAAAASVSDKSCNSAPPLRSLSRKSRVSLNDGVSLGGTIFEQITRCVHYDAVLSGGFFKDLERIRDSSQVRFRRKGQPVSAFQGDLVLEVQPVAFGCPWEIDGWTLIGPRRLESVERLRFTVRWLGALQRDIGEVQSEFLHEPMQEMNPPAPFYRMKIAAQGVPLNDALEVAIFAESGEQLACIRGHI